MEDRNFLYDCPLFSILQFQWESLSLRWLVRDSS